MSTPFAPESRTGRKPLVFMVRGDGMMTREIRRIVDLASGAEAVSPSLVTIFTYSPVSSSAAPL
ncbi:hypothetical protein [Streptosporangium sp. NPDC004631]